MGLLCILISIASSLNIFYRIVSKVPVWMRIILGVKRGHKKIFREEARGLKSFFGMCGPIFSAFHILLPTSPIDLSK